MEFLNPAGLYAFLVIPLLLIVYLIRRRRRVIFSSLFLLQDLTLKASGRPWSRLRIPLLFFLQLLFLGLLALALGHPTVVWWGTENLAIVLDNSASMQALEGKESRFAKARREARQLVTGLSSSTRIGVYLTVPRIQAVGTGLGPKAALELIGSLHPYDLAESSVDTVQALSRLVKEGGFGRVFFLTDRQVRERHESLEVISVGQPQGNAGLTAFYLTPSLFSSKVNARIEVANFDFKERKVSLALKGGGKLLSVQTHTLGPRRNVTLVFDDLPFHPYYEAELQEADALALDNRRFAVPPEFDGLSILGVSPKPHALRSLSRIPGLDLKVITPDAYKETRVHKPALEIFHFSTPRELPQNHALFILPPKGNPLVTQGKVLNMPVISAWKEPHPLTRYVNFNLLRPSYARSINAPPQAEMIIESPEGALAVAMERNGFRYVVLGFDPFPYGALTDLPMSVFTLNLLSWFSEGGGHTGLDTGEPLSLTGQDGRWLITPKGRRIPISGGTSTFSRTYFQGLYHVNGNAGKKLIAVNFNHKGESDLARQSSLDLGNSLPAVSSPSTSLVLWPFLILICLFLLILEWFLNPLATRLFSQAPSSAEPRHG